MMVTPLPARISVLLGVLVALLGIGAFYWLRPLLAELGYQPYAAYLLSLSVALGAVLLAALLSYASEGQPWTREAFLLRTLPPILVGTVALAYVVQRTRSTWVGVVAHLVNNGLPFLILLLIPVQAAP
jgi:hypothetical protein